MSKMCHQRFVVLICSVSLVLAGCSGTTDLSSTDPASIDPDDGRVHVIKTRDGQTVRAYDFEVTDDSFVVTAISDENVRVEIEPMTIKFADVESVERVGVHGGRTAVALGLFVAAVGFLAWFAYGISGLGNSN